MKLLFVADGRSPTALNWISYFIKNGDEVHLVSSYPCQSLAGLASFRVIPVGMSQTQAEGGLAGKGSLLRKILPVSTRSRLRQWLAPFTLSDAAAKLRIAIDTIRPDLIHALRIPFEGMLAAQALTRKPAAGSKNPPLLLSVWGNDFTLHADSTPWMAEHTRHALRHAAALHTDCQRDRRLAEDWGFSSNNPAIVLPGGGGIDLHLFHPGVLGVELRPQVVINPRGFRAYVRNDTFFQAIPQVVQTAPAVRFLCPGMVSEVQAQKWLNEYGIGSSVELLPFQTRQGMAELYRQAQIVVSLTTHDGTPNSLLEAMACGCFPIVGDLESLRELITDHENGLLVDPSDAEVTATAILEALNSPQLLAQAAQINIELVRERAEYDQVMAKAQQFYTSLID